MSLSVSSDAQAIGDLEIQEYAACSIQRVWRGYRVRSTVPICSASLETEYASACRTPVDVYKKINFIDYLDPNERNPMDVRPHLQRTLRRGVIVSTGTERSFFDLALATPCRCEGLVVRDINPRVKAYVDFVTLLLRISESCEEFRSLSEGVEFADPRFREVVGRIGFSCPAGGDAHGFAERVALIRQKLMDSPMPEEAKLYYDRNLEDFAKVYFFADHRWKYAENQGGVFSEQFLGAMYYKDRHLFEILQKYARAGNIIATVGDIGEIDILRERTVSVVDVSNIPDYTLIDLKKSGDRAPLVIWTCYPSCHTEYHSHIYEYMSPEDREQFTEVLRILKETGRITGFLELGLQIYGLVEELRQDDGTRGLPLLLPSYSPQILRYLQEYKRRYVRHVPSLGWVCFRGRSIERLNALDEKGLQDFVDNDEIRTDRVVKDLICQNSVYLDARVIKFFCERCVGFF